MYAIINPILIFFKPDNPYYIRYLFIHPYYSSLNIADDIEHLIIIFDFSVLKVHVRFCNRRGCGSTPVQLRFPERGTQLMCATFIIQVAFSSVKMVFYSVTLALFSRVSYFSGTEYTSVIYSVILCYFIGDD